MTETRVERVARALSVADGMHPEAVSNDEDQTPVWTLYVDDARVAIDAMDCDRLTTLEAAVRSIIKDMQEYINPKSDMTNQELIGRVIEAVDNDKIYEALEKVK